MTDRKEPSQPDERVEKLAESLHDGVYYNCYPESSMGWEYMGETGPWKEKKDCFRAMAEMILTNFVSKEEHEKLKQECQRLKRGDLNGST